MRVQPLLFVLRASLCQLALSGGAQKICCKLTAQSDPQCTAVICRATRPLWRTWACLAVASLQESACSSLVPCLSLLVFVCQLRQFTSDPMWRTYASHLPAHMGTLSMLSRRVADAVMFFHPGQAGLLGSLRTRVQIWNDTNSTCAGAIARLPVCSASGKS